MLTGARRVLGVAGGRILSPGGLHMRIWLWHCTSGWSAGGGQLGTEAGGTEVALEERPGAPHAAGGDRGEGGGEGETGPGEPHWVW